MSDKNDDAIFSWQSIFESKIKEMEEKITIMEEKNTNEIDKLKRYIYLLNQLTYYERVIMFRFNSYLGMVKGTLSNFNLVVTQYTRRKEVINDLNQLEGVRFFCIKVSYILYIIVHIASNWEIPFEQLASYLKGNFKEDMIHLQREEILNYYGAEALNIWDSLLKT